MYTWLQLTQAYQTRLVSLNEGRTQIEHYPKSIVGWLEILLLPCLLALVNTCTAQQLTTAEDDSVKSPLLKVDYLHDVAPILAKHCTRCHGVEKQNADLRLDWRTAILKGSDSGAIVHSGDSSTSRLLQVIVETDSDLRMPPEGEPLSEPEISKLRNWIDQGTEGPDDMAGWIVARPWSFEPVQRPDGPAGLAAIDFWLEKQLRQANMTFSEPAAPAVLIRRLFLVALGVPPTPSEVQQFISESSQGAREHIVDRYTEDFAASAPLPLYQEAYERLVDRVLADPRFGQRLARHWFDVVRFAESHGFETNRVRYDAWPYRDYVIDAFNQDLPYNRFVTEQIAGDALGVDAATGYLVAGCFDLVKSPDMNLTLMQRQDELADLINTTGTAFLGLTLGCARCHDHKFDPITQTDFYGLQAALAGVNFGSRRLPRDATPETARQITLLRQQLAEVEQQLKNYRQQAESSGGSQLLRPSVNAQLNSESFTPLVAKAVKFTIHYSANSEPCIDEWEVFNSRGQNVALASLGSVASASGTLAGYLIHQLDHIHDGQLGNERSWISNEVNGGFIRIDFAEPQQIERMQWSRDRRRQFSDRLPSRYSIQALLPDGQWQEIASSRDRFPLESASPQWVAERLNEKSRIEFQQALNDQQQWRRELSQLESGTEAWLGTFAQPPTVYRLHRGDPLLPREEVAPSVVAALQEFTQLQALDSTTPEQSRRLAVAAWLTDPNNPLTRRVIVNRLWLYVFGAGMVDTPSDFGANGAAPSHPELLDWLSDEFLQGGWSIKHIYRLLLLSRAFQQSSAPNSVGLQLDAQSRQLWRFPPRRLEAEAIRDSILVASNLIDWQIGGPGFFLQQVEQDNVYRYFPKEEPGPADFRRMVYLTRVRNEQDSVFGAFDCPSGNQVVPQRNRSNTPLQALNLFNSQFVQQQSQSLADRLQALHPRDVSHQVEQAFWTLLSRPPDSYERQLSTEFVTQHGLVAFCRGMFNSSEFLFIF